MADRPFPWKCGTCGERAIIRKVMPYTVQYGHDGRTYTVNVPDLEVPTCENCGEMAFDSRATLRIDQAFRDQIGLLSPDQIRHNRETLGLTQEQLAANLGVASATISRWESGHQIQQRARDRLLRLYFAYPNVRALYSAVNRRRTGRSRTSTFTGDGLPPGRGPTAPPPAPPPAAAAGAP